MDCSLSTRQYIGEFDDLIWTELAEIDTLESLNHSTIIGNDGSKLSTMGDCLLPHDTPHDNTQSECTKTEQPLQSPTLSAINSLVTCRWESINAADLVSVLDDAFSCESGPSIPSSAEEYAFLKYDLLMHPKENLHGDKDIFMANSISESTDVITGTNLSDVVSMDSNEAGGHCRYCVTGQEQTDCKWEGACATVDSKRMLNSSTFRETSDSRSLVLVRPVLPPLVEFGALETMIVNCGGYSDKMESTSNISFKVPTIRRGHSTSQVGPTPVMTSQTKLDESQSSLCCPNMSSVQARRARRHAARQRRMEGQAKKYPLHKLIRMSSPSTVTHDISVSYMATSMPVLHAPVHMVSSSLSGGQSLQINPTPTLLPSVTQMVPAQAQRNSYPILSTNPLQVDSNFVYNPDQGVGFQSTVPDFAGTVEADLINLLQSVIQNELNEQTRVCIRDSLYRLARSAKERKNRAESISASNFCSNTLESETSCRDAMETQTNPIDRWVVNLLFCKPSNEPEARSSSHHPISSEATKQVLLEAPNMNSTPQLWTCRGSFVNLQEQPCPVLMGL